MNFSDTSNADNASERQDSDLQKWNSRSADAGLNPNLYIG